MKSRSIVGLSLFTILMLSGCVTKVQDVKSSTNFTTKSLKSEPIIKLTFDKTTYGKASYYAKSFNGKRTASGEIYNMNAKTAAHRTLPFNTMVKVTDMVTNRSDIVRINDRGPYVEDRIIDLSYASAKKLGLINRGVTDVKIEIVGSDGKVDRRLLTEQKPIKACVGDNCKASIAVWDKGEMEPFKKDAVIESIYEDNPENVINSGYTPKKYDYHHIGSSNKTSIQVGAFRRYAGAKIYAKRYSLLNRAYKAVIKKGIKDNLPIYRVQIEGFANAKEAKRFMSRYSLNGAFLVRR